MTSGISAGISGSEHSARSLLQEFTEDTPCFFASAQETLLARPEQVAERLSLLASERLPQLVAEKLAALCAAGAARPYAVGALPFDGLDTRAPFFLLRDVRMAAGRSTQGSQASARGPLASARSYGVKLKPSPFEYVAAVEQALERIACGELSKVVLARELALSLEQPISRVALLGQLLAQNRGGFAFALDVGASARERRLLLGVSPELLLEKRGARVTTNPLAGSRPRGNDRAQDEALARALLGSTKDLHEHALVVDAVVEALRPWCRELSVPKGPSLVSTPTMWHLSTALSGTLRDPRCSSIALAQALHPTPAVGGQPRAAALEAIRTLEGFARGLFAGAVGYCDADGDGTWAVTLRCAELTPSLVRVCAGAGVVAGSDAWAELDETSAKMGTMLRALGLGLGQVGA